MKQDRGWDDEGNAAREADAAALVEREPVVVSYQEREARNYWRPVLHNNPRQGRDSHRHGYIPPGSDVPGVTPGSAAEGKRAIAKGRKVLGKGLAPSMRAKPLSGDSSWRWGGTSSSSGQSSGSWWNPSAWSGWWDWSGRR